MTRPSIGARRRLFIIETAIETPDGFGGVLRHYEQGPVVWGALEHLSAAESALAGRAEERLTHRVRLRRRTGLDASRRLRLGPRRFRIHAAHDDAPGGRETICLVEEVRP